MIQFERVFEKPLDKSEAKHELNRCLEEGTVVWVKHFREELANDRLTMQDVIRVCRSGAITVPPEPELKTGQWRYRIEGNTADGRRAAVVFTFRRGSAIFITVFQR